jgi:hypothetical protein
MKQLIIPVICFAVAVSETMAQSPAPATAGSSVGQQGAVAATPRVQRIVKKQIVRPTNAQRGTVAMVNPVRQNGNSFSDPSMVDRRPGERAAHMATAHRDNSISNAQPLLNYGDALRRCWHERHDRTWWKARYRTIVFVNSGYYYWFAGYWFPAFGYDPLYDTYDHDGPIYTYGNLLPDQVIYYVQRALQQLGYYAGGLTGSLGPSSRAALAAYQQDAGLIVTGAIDAPTVEALGLY